LQLSSLQEVEGSILAIVLQINCNDNNCVERVCLLNFLSINVLSIGDQSLADASSSNITRLPMFMHKTVQQPVLWKVKGKGRNLWYKGCD
jgi:hypothetical protein